MYGGNSRAGLGIFCNSGGLETLYLVHASDVTFTLLAMPINLVVKEGVSPLIHCYK